MTNSLRDENGLLKNVKYILNDDGSVNWRAMLKPEHLYVNPEAEQELMTKFNVKSKRDIDVTKVDDKQLLITLSGINYLARLRGVKSIKPSDLHVTQTEVTSVCTVEFLPNFENPDGLIVGAQASASLYSVSGQFQLYLATFAQNRAFVRAVKQALGIEILGKDEVDFAAAKKFKNALDQGNNPLQATINKTEAVASQEPVAITPQDTLAKRCGELNKKGSHSFEKIKEIATKKYDEWVQAGEETASRPFESNPNDWSDWSSIPNRDVWTLLGKINEAVSKKK